MVMNPCGFHWTIPGAHIYGRGGCLFQWVELTIMASTTSEAVIRVLRELFATYGLSDTLVSDNGPQFTSASFQMFLTGHGIRHAGTALFHLAYNGLAEWMVRSAKDVLSKLGPGDWQERVFKYLQHVTPYPVTNRSPVELLMGRRLRINWTNSTPAVQPNKHQPLPTTLKLLPLETRFML